MASDARAMRLGTSLLVGAALFCASFVLLLVADSPLDLTAVAGGIGVVISGALTGLTVLAARWQSEVRRFAQTPEVDAMPAPEVEPDASGMGDVRRDEAV